MIAFTRTGYSRAPDRLNNLHNEVKYEISASKRNYSLLTPVPIDINFELTVFAKYQADIDKIASNFMVFFNNDLYVSCEHPKYEGIKMNNQIVMGDNVNEEHPDELDGTQDDVITATFSFIFKTYLFGGTTKAKKKKTNYEVSSYLSTVVSSYPYEFKNDDEVLKYIATSDHKPLSTIMSETITTMVTSYVETSSNISDEYEDGIPKINRLNFGFYNVPNDKDFIGYMTSVDTGLIGGLHKHEYPSAYISSEQYIPIYKTEIDEAGNVISVLNYLSTVNDTYYPIDNWCSQAPYVDRLSWKIDENNSFTFIEDHQMIFN